MKTFLGNINYRYVRRVGLVGISALFATLVIHPAVFAASGYTWTQRTGSGSRIWQDIAMSSDATKLAATVNNGYLYTSSDNGETWVERTGAGTRTWRGIASSANGTKLLAAANGNYLYTSADSGATWTAATSAGTGGWMAVDSSADGSKLIASQYGGKIFTSADSGATWTERTAIGTGLWFSVASSADGTKLAVASTLAGGKIYTSSDSGATWTERTSAGAREWRGIDMSANGSKLIAAASADDAYLSMDGGATWASVSLGTSYWNAVAISADGTKLAVGGTSMRTSADDGATWSTETGSWSALIEIEMSTDGSRIAVARSGNNITTSFNPDYVAPPEAANPDEDIEKAAPNGGDANNDGIPDYQQANVTSFVNNVTNKYVSLEVPDSCTNTATSIGSETSKPAQDSGYDYPAGLLSFTTVCGANGFTATITQYYYGVSEPGLVARKFKPSINGYFMVPNATVSTVTIAGQPVTKIVYQVKDGSELDLDGVENGTIIDPAGPARASVGTPNTGLGGIRR